MEESRWRGFDYVLSCMAFVLRCVQVCRGKPGLMLTASALEGDTPWVSRIQLLGTGFWFLMLGFAYWCWLFSKTKNSAKGEAQAALQGCGEWREYKTPYLIVWEHDLDFSTHSYMERAEPFYPFIVQSDSKLLQYTDSHSKKYLLSILVCCRYFSTAFYLLWC